MNKAQEKNVRAWLSIEKLDANADDATVFRRHRRAENEIRAALQALGHYEPKLDLKIQRTEDAWHAQYRIDPGQRTSITEVKLDIQGPGEDSIKERLQELPELQGKALDHRDYSSFKDSFLNLAFDAGYLEAELSESRLIINPEDAEARVELVLLTGAAFRFGEIQIEQDILDEDFLRRYVHIEQGEPFNADALLDLQLRLTDLDYFQSLEVDAQRDSERQLVDVTIVSEPQKPQRYRIGFGYGTDTGPRVSLNSEFRRLNRRGHRLRNDLRIAAKQRAFSSRYLIPSGREIGANWSLTGQYIAEEFADSETEDYQLGLARTLISGPRLWQFYLKYQWENFRVGEQLDDTELLMPGASLTLRRANDALNPTRGYKFFVDVHGAREGYASSDSFLQSLVQARYIYPISGHSRFLLRGQWGYSLVGDISELPLSQRFFAGGDQSVRGYAYQSLGPRDDNGDVIGGKYLSVVSVELDRLFYKNYGAAVFYDYGGASEGIGESLVGGLGLGFRWRTGIGMVRADAAYPLDDPESGVRFHIGIGAEL